MKDILKFIGKGLLMAITTAVFIISTLALGICVTLLLAYIGRWVGIGQDVFLYAVLFIATWKVWDMLVWVVERIAINREREQNIRKCRKCKKWGTMDCPSSEKCYITSTKTLF